MRAGAGKIDRQLNGGMTIKAPSAGAKRFARPLYAEWYEIRDDPNWEPMVIVIHGWPLH